MSAATAAPRQAHATNVTLQLKSVPQAQFAGYYAAVKKGYYARRASNVDPHERRPEHRPGASRRRRQAQYGVDWLPSLLLPEAKGTDVVNIAQVFARSRA